MNDKYVVTSLLEYLNIDKDYSGEYYDLYSFIMKNDLQELFVVKYSKNEKDLTIDNWEEYVRGEIDSDEEIISDIIGTDYKIFYDDDNDSFLVKKKKTNRMNYKIIYSSDEKIIDVLDEIGIYSEYKPRLAVVLDNEIIGGSSYEIDSDNVYNFDIGILDEYQGYGISKKLINRIISDARKLKTDGIKAQTVNDVLFHYLINNGFEGSVDSGIKYVYKKLLFI